MLIAALLILGVIAAILLVAAMRPSVFRIERSAVMNAPPEKIFAQVNDMKAFNGWNPFLRMEPEATLTYSGPEKGMGAAYTWEGKRTGMGRMEVIQSVPPAKVAFDLEFVKPFTAKNKAEFAFAPEAGGTRVTWAMTGNNTFIPKLMGLFMSMDKMVGKSFEGGLASLKAIVEK